MLQNRQKIIYSTPYTLTVKGASEHFGFATGTLYNWINNGKLQRGVHYLKVGNKPMIIRDKFIEWMEAEDGSREAR
jgi:hypothetical protein